MTVRERLIDTSGLRDPERAFVAVPRLHHSGVGRVGDQTLLGVHSELQLGNSRVTAASVEYHEGEAMSTAKLHATTIATPEQYSETAQA